MTELTDDQVYIRDMMFTVSFLYNENYITKERRAEIMRLINSPDKENLIVAELLLENYKL